ncbi:MAG: transporter [Acidimicrobiaceae bacterium]|nr:transporter [Acidimicrobiaceae bacterium]
MGSQSEQRGGSARGPGLGLVVEGITKSFGSGRDRALAIADLSVEVPRGRFATVIGPSGCGKSTLLKVVAGLAEADAGTISLFGDAPEQARANKRLGYVPQRPALLPWRTVLENVRFPFQVNRRAGTLATRRPEEVLTSVGLGEVLGRRPHELSGGMQQRVAIARAFAFEPSLLVMDEPFSALDELTRESLRHQLLALWEADQKTVLFVTHSVTEAVVLSDLVIVMSGPPGRVHSVVPVELPRPRGATLEGSEEVQELERVVRRELSAAVAAGEQAQ